ncbi:MAG TPA: hypothetical protein ENN80_14800, partial [Candidatus Hydrogenedentes bacterium]|nr:hypothetical protein [Candidatus Hydrogenedentota bacterium]
MAEGKRDESFIAATARRALPLMVKHKVPPTPQNYQIWFEYAAGERDELVADIDARLAFGETFTEDVNRYLYEKHFTEREERELMEHANQESQRILKGIVRQLLSQGDLTSAYGDKLQEYSRQLDSATEVLDIQHVIADMLKETHEMTAQSRRMQQELRAATEQADALRKRLKETEKESLTDPLTGLGNRKAFNENLAECHA